MFKLILLFTLLLSLISDELYSKDIVIDTVYIVIDISSQEYSTDLDQSSNKILITTQLSKKNYEDFIKKQSESRYWEVSSADFDAKSYYTYHIKSSPDSILTVSEYANFESKKTNIISFIDYEKPENMILYLRSIKYFLVKNMDSKNIYFYSFIDVY